MGTRIAGYQKNIFTGKYAPASVWYDDGLTVAQRMEQPEYLQGLLDLLEKRGVSPVFVPRGIVDVSISEGKPAILGNWNNADRSRDSYGNRMTAWIEGVLGWEPVFSDEYALCDHCGRAVRTSPDSYGWEPYFIWTEDGDFTCGDCLKENPEFLEDIVVYYDHNPERAFFSWCREELADMGFVCPEDDEGYCERFETGFHRGQDDDPKEVLKFVGKEFPGAQIVFIVDNIGQFDITWHPLVRYIKEEE